MFTPSMTLDIVAYDRRGGVVLLAEAKSVRGKDGAWAAQFRRNLLSHGTLPFAQFFLIVTAESMYFWKQANDATTEELPDQTLDAAVMLKRYLERLHQSPERIDSYMLQWIVSFWLEDIVATGGEEYAHDPSSGWLFDSGFIDAISGAHLQFRGL